MSRAHLFRPVTNADGTPLYGASVTVREADLSGPIAQTIWDGPLPTANSQTNPIVANGGYVDIWLDQPKRVNLLVQWPGAPDAGVFLDVSAAADEIVVADTPLRITNAPSAGQVLLAVDEQTAAFGPPPVQPQPGQVPVHQHPGTGADTVSVGTGASASASYATAFGVGAQATGVSATAVGHSATAPFDHASAIGSGASVSADEGTAVGYQATAGSGSVAVGVNASATSQRGTAVGGNSQAQGDGGVAFGSGASAIGQDSVAVGDNALSTGVDSTALGANSSAQYDRSVAIGSGVSTDQVDQVKIGGPGQSVLVPGQFVAQSDVSLAGTGSTLGFFGSSGAPQQVVTGSDGGDLTLRAVIEYLAAIGLIVDSTTKG